MTNLARQHPIIGSLIITIIIILLFFIFPDLYIIFLSLILLVIPFLIIMILSLKSTQMTIKHIDKQNVISNSFSRASKITQLYLYINLLAFLVYVWNMIGDFFDKPFGKPFYPWWYKVTINYLYFLIIAFFIFIHLKLIEALINKNQKNIKSFFIIMLIIDIIYLIYFIFTK